MLYIIGWIVIIWAIVRVVKAIRMMAEGKK
jgi:hypothetical protein